MSKSSWQQQMSQIHAVVANVQIRVLKTKMGEKRDENKTKPTQVETKPTSTQKRVGKVSH